MSDKLSRRQFIKAGALGTALAGAGAAGMLSLENWVEKVDAEENSEERIAYTFHQQTCGGNCSLKCTVRGDRLCLIEPNDIYVDKQYATACLRGISEIQHIYSIDRIQTPLKRVGERGSGEFIAITWDEAFQEIKDRLTELWGKYGKECVLPLISNDARFPFINNIFGGQSGGFGGIDIGVSNGLLPAIGGQQHTYMGATAETRDWINSRTIVNLGCNYMESSLIQSRYWFDAKEAGAFFITVDPHFSTAAAKSQMWVPITPGTDGALLLAMITLVLDNMWYDADFMMKYTSFPFLIDLEDGIPLQDHAPDPEASMPEPAFLNPNIIWDTVSDSAQPYTAVAALPALEGTYTINEKKYATVFDILKNNQRQYTVDWASKITGIDAATIEDITRRYATLGPSSLAYGMGGLDKFYNADVVGHSMAILAALTGNVGKPGGSVGLFSGYANAWYASLGSWPLPETMSPSPVVDNFIDLPYKENSVRAIFTFGDKLYQWYANMNKAREWWTSLDFIVFCDIYHAESADFADLILPACTKFESIDDIGGLRQADGFFRLQEKVLDPLFESKPDFWIEHEIAKLFGVENYLPQSSEEYVRALLSNPEEPFLEGVTLEKIRANQSVLPFSNCEGVRVGFSNRVFSTGSGRLEVYYPSLVSFDQQLPNYEEPIEAYAGNELRNTYPLQLHGSRPKYFIHNQFQNATWIKQYMDSRVEMNAIDAEARGLFEGDLVEIFNDRGKCSTKAVINNSIRPGSIQMYEGNWTKYMESGNVQALANNTPNPRGYALWIGPVTPFNDTLVEVRKAGDLS